MSSFTGIDFSGESGGPTSCYQDLAKVLEFKTKTLMSGHKPRPRPIETDMGVNDGGQVMSPPEFGVLLAC